MSDVRGGREIRWRLVAVLRPQGLEETGAWAWGRAGIGAGGLGKRKEGRATRRDPGLTLTWRDSDVHLPFGDGGGPLRSGADRAGRWACREQA